MKTRNKLRHLLMAATTMVAGHVLAQCDVTNHNGGFGYYLGWNASAGQDLEVRNDANKSINWFTDAIQRLMLYPTNNATLNSFTVPRNGFVSISPQPLFYNNPGAFTRLHLVDSVDNNPTTYAQDFGFRPWMRNGVTMTGNSDQMYVGHKYTYVDSTDYESGEINDRSDAVIEWSDNPDDAPWGTDRLRFMFTNTYNVAAPPTFGAQSLEGLEAMRIFIPNDLNAHVGIGDFFRAGVVNGANEDPTERLHIRDGRVRIQQLPDDLPADSDFVVMVVDTSSTSERGVVKWVPASAILSAADCEWSMTGGAGAGVNDVWTATGALVDGCPDQTESVGIGTSSPSTNAKLHVYTNSFADATYVQQDSPGANVVGARLEVTAGTGTSAGVSTQVSAPGTQNWGAFHTAYGATGTNFGAQVLGGGGGTGSIGLAASAGGGSTASTAITGAVSVASPRNIGDRITVSGGTVFNVGDSILVSGGAASNRGISVSTSGASASNTGIIGTVSGTSTANSGAQFTVSGNSSSNMGMSSVVSGSSVLNTGISTTVSGTANANAGAVIRSSEGTVSNEGMNIRASSTAASVLNTGITVQSSTNSNTSENRGINLILGGAADRSRGLELENSCTNAGGAVHTKYGGFFKNIGTSFLYSYALEGISDGAPSADGVSRGAVGKALNGSGPASKNTGVCGVYGTDQPTDRAGSAFGVFGQNKPSETSVNVGTAGYVHDEQTVFPRITGRTGVAGVCRPEHDGFNAGTLGYVGPHDPVSWPSGTFGVYGASEDTAWAGYFDGYLNVNGDAYLYGTYWASDENLKENFEMIGAQGDPSVIGQLEPGTYNFTAQAVEQLGLPAGLQAGLKAQQLQEVLPHLVKAKTQPALIDTLGNVIQSEQSVLMVNYVGLIPYLIADNQRLQTRLDQMQEQLSGCCANGADHRAMGSAAAGVMALETDLRIIPNPVADRTELRYTVAMEGAVRLEISDADGRRIQVQDEGTRSTGTFGYAWDTTSLAAGTYFCTLYVNDEPLVKKAVKLNMR